MGRRGKGATDWLPWGRALIELIDIVGSTSEFWLKEVDV